MVADCSARPTKGRRGKGANEVEELALHILDLAENSLAAGARRLEIRVIESPEQDRLTVEIADDGCGMTEQVRERAHDPFFTTRTTRKVGLGLSLLEQAAQATGGQMRIDSQPGAGTRVTAVFRLSHPDRQPLGDMAATLLTLAAGHPEVDLDFEHRRGDVVARFRTAELREEAPGLRLNSPAGIAVLRKKLYESLRPIECRGYEEAYGTGDR